ncbi:MAG: hypothetical protein RJA57_368 [Bacteroidota bacterium]|jgi:transcriptional regulator with XRE-family HTH domain
MPGSLIRRFREMHNYSQKYVASKMGISQNAYSKIENNITQLNVQHLKKISAILNVSVIDLLKDDFEIHKPLSLTKPGEVTLQDLLMHLMHLRKNLESKKRVKHDSYPVIASLLRTVDEIAAGVD